MKTLQREKGGKGIQLLCFLILFLFMACGSSKDTASAEDLQNFRELTELVENREFEIENQWAIPLSGSRINLIGNANFIRFKGDSVDIFLPYFGVRHSGGAYGHSGGIEYKGPAKELEIIEQEANKNIALKFEGQQESENLRFFIKLFPNGKSYTSVTSSQRSTISYQGNIGKLEEH